MTVQTLAPFAHVVAGLDVGGTAMKGTVVGRDGAVLHSRVWRTPRELGPDAAVQAVLDAAAELVALDPAIAAIGLVVPGAVNDADGIAEWSENIGWRDVPFRHLLAERTGLPVGFGHDVRAGGLAERVAGAAQGESNVLFMPIGTGISGAMTVEGVTLTGRYVGEIGHLDVGSGLPCACGGVGCLETTSTGPSIARAYAERTGTTVDGAREVFDAADRGDADAAAVLDVATTAIARALAEYVTLLDPDVIIIGGGLAAAEERLLQPVRDALASLLVWQRMPRILGAAFGANAASLGACLLAREACAARLDTQSPQHVKETHHG